MFKRGEDAMEVIGGGDEAAGGGDDPVALFEASGGGGALGEDFDDFQGLVGQQVEVADRAAGDGDEGDGDAKREAADAAVSQ